MAAEQGAREDPAQPSGPAGAPAAQPRGQKVFGRDCQREDGPRSNAENVNQPFGAVRIHVERMVRGQTRNVGFPDVATSLKRKRKCHSTLSWKNSLPSCSARTSLPSIRAIASASRSRSKKETKSAFRRLKVLWSPCAMAHRAVSRFAKSALGRA